MRHAIERIARANNACMEATFTLMRGDGLSEYEKGELFGRYEQLLLMNIKLKEAIENASGRMRHKGQPIDRAVKINK
jgi:hypothetical protein